MERRRFSRITFSATSRFFSGGKSFDGVVVNISPSGALMASGGDRDYVGNGGGIDLEPGEEVEVEIPRLSVVRLVGKVRHCDEEMRRRNIIRGAAGPSVGIEFEELQRDLPGRMMKVMMGR